MELEGVRGIAALMVVLHHIVFAFYMSLNTGDMNVKHTALPYENEIYGTPLALVYAGSFAVAVFFVLSGFVLSTGFFQTKSQDVVNKLASTRYLRLMIPALASVLLAYLLIKLGAGNIIGKAASVAAGGSTYSTAWQSEVGFIDALKNGIVDIFITGGGFNVGPYNTVLWTMFTEFWGSFMVFGFLLLFAASRHRWIVYLILAMFTYNTWFLPFVLGMILADVHALGWLKKLKDPKIVTILLTGVVLLGSYPHMRVKGTLYEHLNFIRVLAPGIDRKMFFLTLAATMLILAVLLSPRLAAWFSRPSISVLGKYTFSLYLTHKLVLFTFTSAVFVWLHEFMGYNKSVLLAILISIPVFWAVSILFERYVDAPAIQFAKSVGRIYRGEKNIDLKAIFHTTKRRIIKLLKRFVVSLRQSDKMVD